MTGAAGQGEIRLFGDDPIDGVARPDLLNRSSYADHVISLLDRVRAQSGSSVLAVIGPWGSGKSSVLRMTIQRLGQERTSENRWLIAEFNPWNYPDLDSLQAGFFAELRAALPDEAKWSEARKRLGEFGKTISPLGKVASLVGLDASGLITAVANSVGGDNSVRGTKAAAEQTLEGLDQPILMVLDDLDRLTPEELLRVFKLVRLVGRLPNIYYVLCYDERTLLDVLGRTDLVSDSDDTRARDYLEKIVQVRLDLPMLRAPQAAKLFDTAYELILQRNEISLSDADGYRLGKAYWDCLHRYLQTPRSISRFVAQIDAFYGVLHGEVDFVDYTLITWLRTAEPGVFAMLKEHRAALTMTDVGRLWQRRQRSPSDELAEWRAHLLAAGVTESRLTEFIELLALLFLPIRSAKENMTFGSAALEDIGRRRGVGHVDYFDRYFTFGVPEDDMPDADIVLALGLLASEESGTARDRLTDALTNDTDRTLRKLRAVDASGGLPAAQLLVVLAAVYGLLPARSGLFASDPRLNMEFFVKDLLTKVVPEEGVAVLRRMAVDDSGLYLAASTVARAASRASREEDGEAKPPPSWLHDATATLLELISARFDQVAPIRPRELSDEVVHLIWAWWHLDRAGLVGWLRTQVSDNGWPLLDVLARLVPTGLATGGGPTFQTLGEISLETIEDFFGVDHVLAELRQEIDSTDGLSGSHFSMEPTWENRERTVLQVLRTERARREAVPTDVGGAPEGSEESSD